MNAAPDTDSGWSTRLWWTLVGAGLLDWSFRIVSHAPQFSWAAVTALLAGAWGLATVLSSWVPALAGGLAQRHGNAFAWATAVVSVLSFAVWAAVTVRASPNYGTDELAFDQFAAHLVTHGLNPYTHSMAGAFPMFRVSPGGYTYTLGGDRVTQLSYPSLSFLLYVPFLLLGWSRELGVGLDVIGWILSTLLIFRLLPRHLRPAALLVGSSVAYVQLSLIGLTDMLFMPMLLLAAYRWDRFGQDRRSYLGPVMFGLAMAVKQTPWPVLPFVLIGLALDEQARTDLRSGVRRAARYLALTLAAFLIPNLPYIVADPSAWVRGTLTPLTKSLVPAGQGAISFTLFLHLGGGSLFAYSLLTFSVLALLVVAYIGYYPLLKAATFALPAVAYFFAMRSYTAYLVSLVPPGLVAAQSISQPPLRAARAQLRSRPWAWASGALALLCVLVGAYALLAPAPLSVRITNVLTNGTNNIAEEIYVEVHNTSGAAARPAFTMQTASGVSSFWHVLSGPRRLAPGRTATYLIGSPDVDSQFTVNDGITVVAFLEHPTSVSISNRYLPDLWHVGFDPESFENPVALGHPVVVHARLLNEWNKPIRRASVPVTLSQSAALGQSLLGTPVPSSTRPRLASINGHNRGRQATAYTDAAGIATFTIVGRATSIYPDIFSAAIPSGPPLGYQATASASFLIRFRAR